MTLAEASKREAAGRRVHAQLPPAHADVVEQGWQLLPEETRASIIESIDKAMNSMLEKEKREVRLLEESMEHEKGRVEEH